MKDYRILIADLDGTLIDTLEGETFPKGIWDMRLRMEVFEAIRLMSPSWVLVASNQGGIEKGFVDEDLFTVKLSYVLGSLEDYLGRRDRVVGIYCTKNDPGDRMRKPNPGMMEELLKFTGGHRKEDVLMIGDASGKEGQFSDSDKNAAENFGCDYMDVGDFLNEWIK